MLAPTLVTDANGNRAAVAFDELGVPVRTALMGKLGAGEGDTLVDPTTQLDYDLFAYRDGGRPNVIHEQAREQHGASNPRWRESYTYFDGTGRVAMVKVQAEPGLAPQRDGSGALVLAGVPPVPVLVDSAPAVRWVGTGRTVYDNKGNPVKQYEPYFSSIPDFESEAELVEQGVTPVMHYDPLGRLVRVDLPNGTYSRTELGAWMVRSFDPNDTAHDPSDPLLDSEWYATRIGYAGADPALIAARRAAELTALHAATPTTVHLDSQGRAFLTVEHGGFDVSTPILYETRLVLDVVGNVRQVIDALEYVAETRVFGMLQQVLRTDAEDAGWRRAIADVGGAPLRTWNARGFTSRVVYDTLRRPTHHFVTPPSAAEMLVTRTVWGEGATAPENDNLRTRVLRIYDAAGELTNEAYDFKGNLLRQHRRLALEYETTQDWIDLDDATPPSPANLAAIADPLLDDETFAFEMEYDALDRVTSRTTPDDSETLLGYNEAGLLETVGVRIRGAGTTTTFVSDFDYDAKGQRLRCVHGNGTIATYEYDPLTFRLARLHLVRPGSPAESLQDLRYTYDPVGNITQIRDLAQQTVYFDNAVVSADQLFEYSPVYRLVSATGREHVAATQPTHADLAFGPQPHPDDPAALRTYEEHYLWDAVGNILELQHAASGGNFTRQYRYDVANDSNRLLSTSAPGESTEPFSHSYSYDAHGNMTAMPHLAAMAWDHADRLQHCDLGGGGDVWFVYDASGERVRKVQVNLAGTTRRERVYLGGWEVWRERSGVGMEVQEERETLHVGDDHGRLCLVETHTVDDGDPVGAPVSIQRYQHGNHLGSAALELDDGAAIISYEEFHPFGTTSYAANDSGTEVSAKRYRYIGKERDEETGLYHLGARYYASWLARWTAADPIGLGDGPNRYAYARGSPVRLRDISGCAPDGGLLGDLFERHGSLVASLANAGSDAELEQIQAELAGVNDEIESELGNLGRTEAGERRPVRQRDESVGLGSPLTAIRARGPAARTNVPGLGAFPQARGGGETRSLIVDAGAIGVDAVVVANLALVAGPLAAEAPAVATAASQSVAANGIASAASAHATLLRLVGSNPAVRQALAQLGGNKSVQLLAALGLAAGEAAATAEGVNVPGVTTGLGSRSSTAGAQRAAVGAEREVRVAELVGGRRSSTSRDFEFAATTTRTSRRGKVISEVEGSKVDVLSTSGDHVLVGGPAKASDPALFLQIALRQQRVARAHGQQAQFYFEDNTPEAFVDQVRNAVGSEYVHVFSMRR